MRTWMLVLVARHVCTYVYTRRLVMVARYVCTYVYTRRLVLVARYVCTYVYTRRLVLVATNTRCILGGWCWWLRTRRRSVLSHFS